MSKRSQFLLTCLFFVAVSGTALADHASRLATYDKTSGEVFFALSLQPKVKVPDVASEIVVLLDTSASQQGAFRDDSLLALESFLDGLPRRHQVKLMAIDLDAVAMGEGFLRPGSQELKAARQQLAMRTPLGSTDLLVGLQTAVDAFSDSADVNRSVVYIGDGISRANLLNDRELQSILGQLIAEHVSVTSYAIGPQRDISLLAVLANHTGGMVLVDNDQRSGQQFGLQLAEVATQVVLWPTDVRWPADFSEMYPQQLPPLRVDRDSIVIGKLDVRAPFDLEMVVQAGGRDLNLSWKLACENSHDDFAFLPPLVELARDNQGLRLPTVGSEGLREAARMINQSADKLRSVGQREEPHSPHADQVEYQFVTWQDPSGFDEGGDLIDRFKQDIAVRTGMLKTEVENVLNDSRKLMGTAPDRARQSLKLKLDEVKRATDIDQSVRMQLIDKMEVALREAGRRQIEVDNQRRLAEENRVLAEESLRLVEALAADREEVKQLMNRFNALLTEAEHLEREKADPLYLEADNEIAQNVQLMLKNEPIGTSAVWNSRFIRHIHGMRQLRHLRHKNFADALYEVERAAIPFPDEPPIIYPDAETWERLSDARKKYASIDLLGSDTKEREIYDALDQTTQFDFNETPLSEVVEYFAQIHEIPIIIDTRALDDVGLGSDTPVTRTLSGTSLRSALRILLKELELTYIIRDEVLQITTPEEAENELITKVYPVGDLVIPIINFGANTGQLGGGFGGQQGGGGFGGGGFGGGGLGGGGFGGGGLGGGGALNVEDKIELGDKGQQQEQDLTLGKKAEAKSDQPTASAPQNNSPQVVVRRERKSAPVQVDPIDLQVQEGESLDAAWDRYFASVKEMSEEERIALAPRVRETVRNMTRNSQFGETISMLQAAIRHNQTQSWMYEAIALAMRAADAPTADLERVLMSGVDLSDDLDSVMQVAVYMSRLGLDQRALKLFQEIGEAAPFRPEPYAYGLAVAKRMDDLEGIQWACVGILSQAWSNDQKRIEDEAKRLARATLEQLRVNGKVDAARQFEADLAQAQVRDCVVKVTWTGDADVDLLVEEPSATICSLATPRTTSGGVMLGDTFAAPNGVTADGYEEVYVCPKAFAGEYRLLIRRAWGKVTSGKVRLDIYTTNADASTRHIQKDIDLGEKDAIVLFKVERGRRQMPVEMRHLEMLQNQVAMDRAGLTRKLNQYQGSLSEGNATGNQAAAGRDAGRFLGRRRGAAGFQPVLTTLPEGAGLQPFTTAIVSADRRYVRITPAPFFSFIGEVNTFDFGGGNQNGLPDDDDDDNNN